VTITCSIRYTIDPERLADFEVYARTWIRLIEKYGGTHLGYFVPTGAPSTQHFSFPGVGEAGSENTALALFSFPTEGAYNDYRKDVANDPECKAITKHFESRLPFTKYERTFYRSVDGDD
jgi:hypothetical protein